MKKHYRISRILNLAIILCFLMPFFYTGCGPSKAELEAKEKWQSDSIASIANTITDTIIENKKDNLNQDSIAKIDDDAEKRMSEELSSSNSDNDSENTTVSAKISRQMPFLKPILVSNDDTYSGLALVIDSSSLIGYMSVSVSLLLLIISVLAKLIDQQSIKIITLLDFSSFVLLIVSQPISFQFERLWGFYVTLIFSLILVFYDLYILKLKSKEEKIDNNKAL